MPSIPPGTVGSALELQLTFVKPLVDLPQSSTVNPRKLEHGFRMISSGIPSKSPEGHEDNDVPTFWLLLQELQAEGLGFWGFEPSRLCFRTERVG